MWSTICEIECEPMENELDRNDKKLQRMHEMEREGALMCVTLLILSMLVMIAFLVYLLFK